MESVNSWMLSSMNPTCILPSYVPVPFHEAIFSDTSPKNESIWARAFAVMVALFS